MGSPEERERHYKKRQLRERDREKRELKRKKLSEYQDPFDDDSTFYKKKYTEREE